MAAPGQAPAAVQEALWLPARFRTPPFEVTRPELSRLHVPSATYRIQFHPGFGFSAVRKLVPFLQRLGISDVYASPIFQARKGSAHGYDVTDPRRLNPELGTEQEFEALVDDLKRCGIGLILDIVPNHMAASDENPWWEDVLEEGPDSAFAGYFDIDWQPAAQGCENRILLPVLGAPYGRVLENQELQLAVDERGFSVRYWEHRFPLHPRSYGAILAYRFSAWRHSLGLTHPAVAALWDLLTAIERLPAGAAAARSRLFAKQALKARLWELYNAHPALRAFVEANLRIFNGVRSDPQSFELLDRLLYDQAYVLACWRTGREQLNHRRFFDINELVGVRVEDEEVFGATHSLIFRLAREGKIAGLRIDHVDGLYDPSGYLQRLADCLAARQTPRKLYVVAEKILLDHEALAGDWPVCGTTGYDFLDVANAVFVNGSNMPRLETVYSKFTGIEASFDELVCEQKKRVIRGLFGCELRRLTAQLQALASRDRHARECRPEELAAALEEVTARLAVYRTYVRSHELRPADRRAIETAMSRAFSRAPALSGPALDFLKRVLLLASPDYFSAEERGAWLRFVMRWQQFTGAVMAKGMEDTACYIYNRLISLNVVGGGMKPVSVEELHRFNSTRLKASPFSLNATSTHDTKRSEDVRARINVLSELPDLWEECLGRWSGWNRGKKQLVHGSPAPSANDEILLYQVLLGAWPLCEHELPEFRQRIRNFVVKAAREAKTHTSWISPDQEYEKALLGFVDAILEPAADNRFLPDFRRVQTLIAPFGAIGSLSQALLKITCPGVPDFYQGTLLWDFSLVDPDNRRPVDFAKRIWLLEELTALERQDRLALLEDLLENWHDGRIKLYTIAKGLAYRRTRLELFLSGDYLPLQVCGPESEHVIAFARRAVDEWALVVVPRLLVALCSGCEPFGRRDLWSTTRIRLPGRAPAAWRNVFTGELVAGSELFVSDLLGCFPVALLSAFANR